MKKGRREFSFGTISPHHNPMYIRQLLKKVKVGSSVTVCARTATTWAEQHADIQDAIIKRRIKFDVVIADDNAVMGTDDELGKPDVASSVKKFGSINIPADSPGQFRLLRNGIFLPLSYVNWQPSFGPARTLLTAGAGLSQANQRSISLKAPDQFVTALEQVFKKIVAGSRVELRCGKRPSDEVAARKARVFVASSGQSRPIAHEIQQSLSHLANVTVWDQGVFSSSARTLDSLLAELDRSDYGVFVFAADDITITDEGEFQSVRDNVLFEFGLFTGRLGRHRNWFMLPRSAKKTIKTASDLFGISPLVYDDVSGETRAVAIGRACHKIRTTLESAQ